MATENFQWRNDKNDDFWDVLFDDIDSFLNVTSLSFNMISLATTAFHALTDCDQTSAFAGKGKKSAWEAGKEFVRSPQHLKSSV